MDDRIPVANFGTATDIITVVSILIALAWITVLIRIYTRIRFIRLWGHDDTLLVIGLVMYTVEIGCGITYSTLLANKSSLQLDEVYFAINLLLVMQCLYLTSMMVVKASFAILTLRFLVNWKHQMIVYGTMVVTIAIGLALLFFALFQCGYPKSAQVILLNSLRNKCTPRKPTLIINWMHAVLNAATDLILVVMPISLFLRLQLRRREKIIGTFIFLVGASGVIASCVRMNWLAEASSVNLGYFTKAKNFILWSGIEEGCAIIGTAMVASRLFFREHLNFSRRGTPSCSKSSRKAGYRTQEGSASTHGDAHSKGSIEQIEPPVELTTVFEQRAFWAPDPDTDREDVEHALGDLAPLRPIASSRPRV